MKVRFEYDAYPRKSSDVSARDFTHCTSLDEVMDELLEHAPEIEFSIYPEKDDAKALWDEVQKLRAETDA